MSKSSTSQSEPNSLCKILFLSQMMHDVIIKTRKSAYDVIERYFRIEDLKSREILKKIERTYNIPEVISLSAEEEGTPSAEVNEIKIKDKYSSSYFHFKINAF